MATKYATHADRLRLAQTQGARAGANRGHDALANLVAVTTSYTTAGDEAVNDVIKLTAPLPSGMVLVPALSAIVVESDPGTTLTVDIGTKADTDAYATGSSLSTVGKTDLSLLPVDALPETDELLATITAASGLAADARITFYLVFRAVS